VRNRNAASEEVCDRTDGGEPVRGPGASQALADDKAMLKADSCECRNFVLRKRVIQPGWDHTARMGQRPTSSAATPQIPVSR
jgi:hypothetical protein